MSLQHPDPLLDVDGPEGVGIDEALGRARERAAVVMVRCYVEREWVHFSAGEQWPEDEWAGDDDVSSHGEEDEDEAYREYQPWPDGGVMISRERLAGWEHLDAYGPEESIPFDVHMYVDAGCWSSPAALADALCAEPEVEDVEVVVGSEPRFWVVGEPQDDLIYIRVRLLAYTRLAAGDVARGVYARVAERCGVRGSLPGDYGFRSAQMDPVGPFPSR